jgi:glyoxylase-like metal-dependent hydrolase (beta-lactamase superfamily II)
MYLKRIQVGFLQENCYLVGAEYAMFCAVIDPGDEFEKIDKILTDDCKTPSLILLTHAHPDHYGAVFELKQKYPEARICMHKDDIDLYADPTMRRLLGYGEMKIQPVDQKLEDGDVLGLGGGIQITARHTPGHTPGGVCFSTYGLLFTGDTLFRGSIGRTDYIGGNYDEIIKSVNDVIMGYPDEIIVYPGHGPSSSIQIERASNPFVIQQ